MTPDERIEWLDHSDKWINQCLALYKSTPSSKERAGWCKVDGETPTGHRVMHVALRGNAPPSQRRTALNHLFGCAFNNEVGNYPGHPNQDQIKAICRGYLSDIDDYTWACFILLGPNSKAVSAAA